MKTYKFKNPQNGYVIETEAPWAWTLLFGGLYFIRHGAWGQAIIAFIVSAMTIGTAWLIYPFFAAKIIRDAYLRRGWSAVE